MKYKIEYFLRLPSIQLLSRVIIGIVFIYASLDKLIHPLEFARVVSDYKLIPPIFIGTVTLFLPWLEIVCGIFLITGIYKKAAAIILASLLIFFIFAIGVNILRGRIFDCGCFTSVNTTNPVSLYWAILRDVLFLILCWVVIFFEREN